MFNLAASAAFVVPGAEVHSPARFQAMVRIVRLNQLTICIALLIPGWPAVVVTLANCTVSAVLSLACTYVPRPAAHPCAGEVLGVPPA
jgi:hypothetical protein